MPARIFAFLNFKGGVGKTTNVVNLAAGLAYLRGKRVLVVDLDAQCNATYWLLRPSEFKPMHELRVDGRRKQTTWQIYRDALDQTHSFDARVSILRGVPRNENGTELVPLLHLLPASVDLLDIEFDVDSGVAAHRLRVALRQALEPLREDYDFIFLDCPPHLHFITQSAVVAADHLIVPFMPDYLSLSGFRVLARLLKTLRGGEPQAKIDAVIVTRFKKIGNAYGAAVAELKSLVEELQAVQMLPARCAVLEPSIRDDIRIGESASEHQPVFMHAPLCNAATDYFALIGAFLRHFPTP